MPERKELLSPGEAVERPAGRSPSSAGRRPRLAALAGWLALWVVLFAAALDPIRSTLTRCLLLGSAAGLWAGALLLLRRRPWACRTLLTATFGAGALFLLPGRPYDRDALRAGCVRALLSYEGAPFVLGGETRRGMDCSGLVRRGLIDAAGRQGLRTVNPALLRLAAHLWMVDCTARDLGEGWGARLRMVVKTPGLNALDYRGLLPGDVAILGRGSHALAYVGDRTWIETGDRVYRARAPANDHNRFCVPATILRWRVLE